MKTTTVEVEIVHPERMDSEDVSDAVDHMLDAGGSDMAAEVFKTDDPPVIDPLIAVDCVQMDVGDAKVTDSQDDEAKRIE